MKNLSKLFVVLPLAAVVGAIVTPAQAVTVDIRHEYTDLHKQNKDRVMISHRFKNGFGFSVETKTKSGGGKTEDSRQQVLTDNVSNGAEFSLSWQFKPFDGFTLQPGFNWEATSSESIYKPFLRVQYNFDNGLYAAFRYRFEYTRDPENSNIANQDGSRKNADDRCHRPEIWLGYRIGDWRFELNYLWKKSEHYIRYNNHKWNDELDLKVAYKIDKEWTVYGQIGSISYSKVDSDRETRSRIGIQYSF